MKRKRNSKKGKTKKPRMVGTNDVSENVAAQNTEENSRLDQSDNDEFDSGVEAQSISPIVTAQPEEPAPVNSGGPSNERTGKLVYGRRVKVKIKTSKTLDSQLTSSDPPTHSDTDKSCQQVELEKQPSVNEKMEDSANSLSETNTDNSGHPSKISAPIKIKTSMGFSSPSISHCSNAEIIKRETPKLKEPELRKSSNRFDKQELDASLEVIRKIMKMDASEPFNVPVNPIALGIPDYFDVIDMPMDFGTICSNLESGVKYMNSKDVYKDVKYIWDNCYKYNNKGDYILELMKRVKKNFSKYWTAAGLYSDYLEGTNGDSIQIKDGSPSSPGKMSVKNGSVNQVNKKRSGLKKHKDGCLCAICVMIRRRQEREESVRLLEGENEASDDYMDEEGRAEETSPMESPGVEYTSSNMDNSTEQDAGADLEERGGIKLEDNISRQSQEKSRDKNETEMTDQEKEEGEICEHSQLGQKSQEQHKRHQPDDASKKALREETPSQHEDNAMEIERRKAKELHDRNQRAKMYERLQYLEKSMLFELSGTLFNDKHKSVWSGPHSLVKREATTRRSSVLDAVTSFMK